MPHYTDPSNAEEEESNTDPHARHMNEKQQQQLLKQSESAIQLQEFLTVISLPRQTATTLLNGDHGHSKGYQTIQSNGNNELPSLKEISS